VGTYSVEYSVNVGHVLNAKADNGGMKKVGYQWAAVLVSDRAGEIPDFSVDDSAIISGRLNSSDVWECRGFGLELSGCELNEDGAHGQKSLTSVYEPLTR
jgi:hypothetical protein